jgi:hypothetical protein
MCDEVSNPVSVDVADPKPTLSNILVVCAVRKSPSLPEAGIPIVPSHSLSATLLSIHQSHFLFLAILSSWYFLVFNIVETYCVLCTTIHSK